MNTALCNTGETVPAQVGDRALVDGGLALCRVDTPDPVEQAIPAAAAPGQQPAAQPAAAVVEEPELPEVTLNDLQTMFAPESEIIMDQNGFGLINAHTNVYASTYRPQTQSQEMLGYQVTLRITPVSWVWSFGDGATLTTDVPGHPQDRFNEETPTSHVYSETGTFPVNLTTTYEGDYQIEGGAWIPVAGTMSIDAETQQADIWRAKTRNVAEPCTPGSTAWGCTG
ncbi:MAG: PKD domain-containing protein [Micrococcaceae bacterium]